MLNDKDTCMYIKCTVTVKYIYTIFLFSQYKIVYISNNQNIIVYGIRLEHSILENTLNF